MRYVIDLELFTDMKNFNWLYLFNKIMNKKDFKFVKENNLHKYLIYERMVVNIKTNLIIIRGEFSYEIYYNVDKKIYKKFIKILKKYKDTFSFNKHHDKLTMCIKDDFRNFFLNILFSLSKIKIYNKIKFVKIEKINDDIEVKLIYLISGSKEFRIINNTFNNHSLLFHFYIKHNDGKIDGFNVSINSYYKDCYTIYINNSALTIKINDGKEIVYNIYDDVKHTYEISNLNIDISHLKILENIYKDKINEFIEEVLLRFLVDKNMMWLIKKYYKIYHNLKLLENIITLI